MVIWGIEDVDDNLEMNSQRVKDQTKVINSPLQGSSKTHVIPGSNKGRYILLLVLLTINLLQAGKSYIILFLLFFQKHHLAVIVAVKLVLQSNIHQRRP